MSDRERRGNEHVPDAERLNGHSLAELSDYLDRGRMPRDPAIEASASAQHALAALSRLRAVAPRVLRNDADNLAPPTDSWVKRVLDQIGVQAHSGRDIPISHDEASAVLAISEGAVRALIREVGDEIDGVIVERVRLRGDIEERGAAVRVELEVSLFAGTDAEALVDELRRGVIRQLARHTELTVDDVAVAIRDDDLEEEPDA